MLHTKKSSLILPLCALLVEAFTPSTARGDNITLQGSFHHDDDVQLFDFSVSSPGSVDLRSYGYAGSTTSTGLVVPSGGFDTVFTLFTGTGNLITENDDGAGVATDPSTGLASDARITMDLTAGNYILALTQYDNFANSSILSGGFTEAGNPNFTADPTFTSAGPCPGNLFRDISGTAGRCRSGNWTVDFVDVASATAVPPVPEPSTIVLLGLGLSAFGLVSAFRKQIRAHRGTGPRPAAASQIAFPTSLLALLLLWTPPAHAQATNPSFANVPDILDGKRQLLQVQDLIVENYDLSQGNLSNIINTNFLTRNGGVQSAQSGTANCGINLNRVTTIFAGRLYTSDHDEYLSVCAAPGVGAHVQLTDGNNTTTSPEFGEIGASTFSGALADFMGNGYSELAVNYSLGGQNGHVVLISAANADGSPANMHFGNAGNAQATETMLAMAAGDFNGDGRPEIAGLAYKDNGRPSIVVYSVDPKTLAVTKAAEVTPSYAGDNGPITFYSMTTGKFAAADHQQIILTYATNTGTAKLVAFDFAPGSLQPVEQKIYATASNPAGDYSETTSPSLIQVLAARFDPQSPYDQVAFQFAWQAIVRPYGAGTKFLEIYALDPGDLSFQQKSYTDFSNSRCSNPMAIGNFDQKQTVDGTAQYDPSLQIAFVNGDCYNPGQTLNIFSVDPTNFNFRATDQFPIKVEVPYNIFVAAGDLQGRSYVLGPPTKLTITGNIRPTVIAGMPPMHIDYIVPADKDPSDPNSLEVFNFSADPDGFNTSYQTSEGAKVDTNNTNTISWSFGAKETVGATATIGDPDTDGLQVKDTFTAAQDFKGTAETQYGHFSEQTFSQNSTTGYGDFVMFNQSTFTTWIYPVIGKTICPAAKPNCSSSEALPMTIQYSGPQTNQISSVGSAVSWYQPPWEPGNVFSYPANLAQLQKIYPNIQLLSNNSDQWFTDSSRNVEQTTWNVGSSTGSKSTLDMTFSFENDLSVAGTIGVKGFGSVGANYGIDLSGSTAIGRLNQSTTDVNQSTGIGVTKSGGVADPNLYQYGITSYLVGRTKPGGLVDNVPLSNDVQTFDFLQAAFVADPLDTAAGSWWQQNYRDAPDVALNHPARWTISTPGLSNPVPANCVPTGTGASQMDCAAKELDLRFNPWLSPFYYMRGLFISSASYPGQGPTLTQTTASTKLSLLARVYNYSFTSMPEGSTVHVRFYAQPWNQRSNTALVDPVTHTAKPSFLVGPEAVLSPIPPFSDVAGDPLNWVLARTTFDTTGYDDQYFTFWVVVWIQDASGNMVPEVGHHGLKSIPGVLTSFAQVQTEDYSNNLGFWKQSFYVAPPNSNLNPGLNATLTELNIGKIQLSSSSVAVGQPIIVSALLSAEGQGASNVAALFWDEDPNTTNTAAFSLETPSYIPAGGTHQVSAIYRPKTCGMHQIFITVQKGMPGEVDRSSSPIQVSCAANGGLK